MSRRGTCWDNALAESFFSGLKKERIKRRIYKTHDMARADVIEYIEVFYNRQRRRNPDEVGASLEARDGLDPDVAKIVWLRHVLDAELHTRSLRRSFVHYDGLMADWQDVVQKVSSDTGLIWPRQFTSYANEFDDYLSPDLRHHFYSGDVPRSGQYGPAWVQEVYEIFNRWTAGRLCEGDMEELDRIRLEFETTSRVFSVGIERNRYGGNRGRDRELPAKDVSEPRKYEERTPRERSRSTQNRDARISQSSLRLEQERAYNLERELKDREIQLKEELRESVVWKERYKEKDAHLKRIHLSRSWGWTAPLRFVSGFRKKGR